MPIYVFRCPICQVDEEYIFPIPPPAAIKCMRANNHWAVRTITAHAGFKIDGVARTWQGDYSTPAFKEKFKNETEMKAFARDQGCVSIEHESLQDLEKMERQKQTERDDELYKHLAEPANWSDR